MYLERELLQDMAEFKYELLGPLDLFALVSLDTYHESASLPLVLFSDRGIPVLALLLLFVGPCRLICRPHRNMLMESPRCGLLQGLRLERLYFEVSVLSDKTLDLSFGEKAHCFQSLVMLARFGVR